jgi:polo-like kinase 1
MSLASVRPSTTSVAQKEFVPTIKAHGVIEEKSSSKKGRKYVKGRFLGKGGFAQCFEVQSTHSGNIYAAKVIDKKSLVKEKTKQKLTSEIKIHAMMNHRHIVKFERYFEDDDNVYIILEICYCHVCIQRSNLHNSR